MYSGYRINECLRLNKLGLGSYYCGSTLLIRVHQPLSPVIIGDIARYIEYLVVPKLGFYIFAPVAPKNKSNWGECVSWCTDVSCTCDANLVNLSQ